MFFQYSREFLLVTAMCVGLLKRESTTTVIYSPKEMLTKSLVQEWSHGSLMDFQTKVAVSELSLVFYYAPWCTESLVAKKLFTSLANSYHEEAYFSAVNCWQLSSICRMNYLYQWPVLIAYFSNSFSVQYNGEWNSYSLVKFIDVLLAPIVRIYTMQQLIELKKSSDAIVFGVFRSSNSEEYQAFFQASVKRLEISSFQSVTFAAYIGDENSIFLNEKNAPTLKIFIANETIVYGNSKWLPDKIIYFFKKNVIILRNNICSTLSSIVKKNMQFGPVLLMLSPTISTTLDYSIMKEIVYNYKKGFNITMLKDYINYFEKDQIMQRQLTQFCKLIMKSNDKENQTDSQNVQKWADIVSSLGKKDFNVSHHEATYYDLSPISLRKNCYKQTYCNGNLWRYHITKADYSFNTNRMDYRSPLEILKRHLKKRCSYLGNVSQKFLSVIQTDNQKKSPELQSNKTMAIVMLPYSACSHYFKHFLGDFEIPSSSPSLLIVDKNAETSYVQKDTFTLNKTIQFIDGLHKGTLPRHLRSSSIPENRNFSNTTHVKVKELNSSQFSNIMQWTNMTLIVLVYSPQCPACHIISQKLLHISYIVQLRNVQFYRLDGTTNDLPWEFTTDKYPTLFVFPQKRSINANTFTSSSKINVRNLLGFILSQLKPDQQLYSIINACKLTKISLLFQNCIQHARVMVSDQINNSLRKWSHIPRQRIMILQKLITLKKIYFELIRARKSFDLECILKLIKI